MTTRKGDLPMIPFAAREAWLEEHHTTSDGLWLEIAGKGSGMRRSPYPSPRLRSVLRLDQWSKINRVKVSKLMRRAG
jgi:hypothetical protein